MSLFTVLVGVAGLALSGVASAQSATEPLKGPPVRDNSVPGSKGNFGSGAGKNGKDRLDQMGTPMPVFMKAIDTLRSEAAGDHKLTQDQDAGIKAQREEFETSTKSYMQQYQDEVVELLAKISPEDRARFGQVIGREGGGLELAKRGFKGGGKKKDAPTDDMKSDAGSNAKPAVSPEESGKARERLKAIFDGRPSAKDTQTKMFGQLTDTQKKLVQDALQKQRDELAKRAASRKSNGKGDNAPSTAPHGEQKPGVSNLKGKSADEIMNDPRIPERLRDRLKSMSPEEREKAIERLRDRAKGGKK